MGMLGNIEAGLQGKKAYIVMIAAIIGAICAYITGNMTLVQAIEAILAALGLGAMRSAVGKVSK